MQNIKSLFLLILIGCLANPIIFAKSTSMLNPETAAQIAKEAYIYAYPLVTMEMTRRITTNVTKPDGMKAPMGQFANLRNYPTADFRDVTTPNADTLYSFAWIDLTVEPYVLHVPEEPGRYYLMPLLSAWTDVFADPGTRTTGTRARDFLITGPNWKGPVPNGMSRFQSPTNLVWVLGRTYCTGTPEDYQAVHAIQDQYKLVPLSMYDKPDYVAPEGKVDPTIDMKTTARDQVNALDAGNYYQLFAYLLTNNPPAPDDAPMVSKLKKLGIVPGKPFDINQIDPMLKKALEDSVKLGQADIMSQIQTIKPDKNGWVFLVETGRYGTRYLQRAMVAAIGLGANLPRDALYPSTTIDSQGQLLQGANQYVIHFAKDALPPVDGFWSLTLYDEQYFFVPNSINRYTLSPRDNLQLNPDGSLDLYIQNETPETAKMSNWLPAPLGRFVLVFRFYWPKQQLLSGSWLPPAVQKVLPQARQ